MLQFIAALPTIYKILKLVFEAVQTFEKKFGPDWVQVIDQSSAAIEKLKKAETPEEDADAIKGIAQSLNRIRPASK
jgi:hypothetical protein